MSFGIPAIRSDVETVSIWNPGIHGMSEVLYAFTSAANNNGSAFAGLTANTPWLNTALGVAMLLGRFIPIVFVLALAGSLAAQDRVPDDRRNAADLPPQFRAARGRHRHLHRTHLLPGARAGSPRGRACMNVHRNSNSDTRRRAAPPKDRRSPNRAFGWAQLVRALPGACASSTRRRSGATPSCSSSGWARP